MEQAGGEVVGCAFVIELAFLGGRERLAGRDVRSLITYDDRVMRDRPAQNAAASARPRERVWALVSDPDRLPRWWPARDPGRGGGRRGLDDRARDAARGKTVRADYTLLESRRARAAAWRQELEESPFERIMLDSSLTESAGAGRSGGTRVRLADRTRLRGLRRASAAIQVRRRSRATGSTRRCDGLASCWRDGR